jgi:probable addiction module antidote protein
MMVVTTTKWDVADYLDSAERIAGYLEAAFEEGDPDLILTALNDVARARGMTDMAEKTGLTRQALYKALGANGNPTLATLLPILKALGVRLSVVAAV